MSTHGFDAPSDQPQPEPTQRPPLVDEEQREKARQRIRSDEDIRQFLEQDDQEFGDSYYWH